VVGETVTRFLPLTILTFTKRFADGKPFLQVKVTVSCALVSFASFKGFGLTLSFFGLQGSGVGDGDGVGVPGVDVAVGVGVGVPGVAVTVGDGVGVGVPGVDVTVGVGVGVPGGGTTPCIDNVAVIVEAELLISVTLMLESLPL